MKTTFEAVAYTEKMDKEGKWKGSVVLAAPCEEAGEGKWSSRKWPVADSGDIVIERPVSVERGECRVTVRAKGFETLEKLREELGAWDGETLEIAIPVMVAAEVPDA